MATKKAQVSFEEALERLEDIVQQMEDGKLTLDETSKLYEEGVRLAAHYPLVVVKRGAAGCEAFAGDQRWRVSAPPAQVNDSTGAGDAFVAAFLVARLAGRPIEHCLTEAVAAGAAATEFIGGQPEIRRPCD